MESGVLGIFAGRRGWVAGWIAMAGAGMGKTDGRLTPGGKLNLRTWN